MAAARFSSDVLQTFYGPITEEENRNLPQASAAVSQSLAEEPTISEAIKKIPPELREMILKEYIAIKIRERSAMGWDEVHGDLLWAPFCLNEERIVKVFISRKCRECG